MSMIFSMKFSNGLEKYKDGAMGKIKKAIEKHAFRIQAGTVKNIDKDHLIKTGAFKGSIAALPDENSDTNWTVQDGVNYGIFLELGTSRGIVAHHVLGNACESDADKFFDDVREALE